MATKITKKDNFKAIVTVLEQANRADLVEVMNHEIELLEKKNSYKSDKPTKLQVENANLKALILSSMEQGKNYTVTDICELINVPSNQKVTALVTQLAKAEQVRKTVDKRKSYFSLA